MKPRYALAAVATMLVAGAASAQYVPATYQEPYCREFTKVVTVGGRPENAYGKACYKPDGSWEIVSDDIPSSQPVTYYPEDNYVAYQPAAYVPAPAYAPPAYYVTPRSAFSISFNSWNPNRTRYYNDHGHGWRDWDRGRGDWNRGRGHNHHGYSRGRGHDRH